MRQASATWLAFSDNSLLLSNGSVTKVLRGCVVFCRDSYEDETRRHRGSSSSGDALVVARCVGDDGLG